jgi:hypothetical protein
MHIGEINLFSSDSRINQKGNDENGALAAEAYAFEIDIVKSSALTGLAVHSGRRACQLAIKLLPGEGVFHATTGFGGRSCDSAGG